MAAIIMLDVDGVLANFHKSYWRLWNTEFNLGLNVDEVPGTWDALPQGATPLMETQIWRRINTSSDFWLGMSPLYPLHLHQRLLNLEEHDLYFVTSRTGKNPKAQTEQWLTHQGFNNPTVLITKRKGEVALALNANYFIDDKAGNAVYVGYHSPKTKSYLMDYPKNRFPHEVIGSKVIRVNTLEQFLDDIRKDGYAV